MTDSTNSDAVPSKQFLSELGAQFEFNIEDKGLMSELRLVFRRYSMDRHVFDNETTEQTLRSNYQTLKSETERFRQLLSSPDYEDLETDLYWAALHSKDPEFDTSIPVIGDAESKRPHAYLSELNRLLALLETAADLGVARFAPAKGRKRNLPLENVVRRLAYIWSDMLERRFTVDYHQGSGLTTACNFVSVIVAELDSEITKTEIVTAMRTIIKERGKAGLR